MEQKDGASPIQLVETATQRFLEWIAAFTYADEELFQRARTLATRLGARYRADGLTEIAFWLPDVKPDKVQYWGWATRDHQYQIKSARDVYLEVFTPLETIDFRAPHQTVPFRRDRIPLRNHGDYFCGVFSGMQAGTRERAGCFYWLRYLDRQDEWRTYGDVLAYSLPYGAFAPAELYDVEGMQQQRADRDYFSQGPIEVPPPRNILQLHVNTASAEGSLEGLTRVYQTIGHKLQAGETLTPTEENYIGYDAVQLLPIEPVVEYWDENSSRRGFFTWKEDDRDKDPEEEISVTLRKPNSQNWGYDIVISASSAVNPAVLGSLRPDELVDFIAELHTFPTGPIHIVYDLVYGHTDKQSELLLNRHFLQGGNMYGQDINHQNPAVRAILLEMQRRKINTGADGIRVDGAQDFKFFNPRSGKVEYDDDYLKEMSNVRQRIGYRPRKLFAIFEDGRPWPQPGWEELSTYRDVIAKQPKVYQWGPLIFAHNTPSLKHFWDKKWWRVQEVMTQGSQWITGCANHDTVRRGTQIDPQADINWNLGETLPEVLQNAYDNPAVTLLFYGFSPGVPMDFLNATMRAPWCFFRNTDDYYGLKVMAEEVGFLDWQVYPELYEQPWAFKRVKQLGFDLFKELRWFLGWLNQTVAEMEDRYDLATLADLCHQALEEKKTLKLEVTVRDLKRFSQAYMEDCHDLCNVSYYENLDPKQAAFNLALRHYRRDRAWLRLDLTEADCFDRISDEEKTIFYGVRSRSEASPHDEESASTDERVAIAVHMGGAPVTLDLAELLSIDLAEWQVAIASPDLTLEKPLADLNPLTLTDSQGILLEPKC